MELITRLIINHHHHQIIYFRQHGP